LFPPDASDQDGRNNKENGCSRGGEEVGKVDESEFLRGRNMEENPGSVGWRKRKPGAIERGAGEVSVEKVYRWDEAEENNGEDVCEGPGRTVLFEN